MPDTTSRSFNIRIRYFIGLVLCILSQIFFAASPVSAANGINRSFNYQGRLLTSAGANVTDGTYSIKFSLYDAASGGNRIYTASGTTSTPAALSVTVTNGLFSVLLGDTSSGQNALNIDWNSDTIYIGVLVNGDLEMTPRKRLSAVPYAFNSETLQGNYASSGVDTAGGNLMSLHQTSTTAATAARTTLFIQTNGTSNDNDFLLKGNNGSSDVFTISREGNATTTGNFAANGSLTFGSGSGTSLMVSGQNVCLANGINCTGSTDTLASVSARGSFATSTLQLYGGFDAASSTVTSTLTVLGDTSLGGVTFTNATGTNTTSTNFFATTLAWKSASGSSLLVAGQSVCLADGTNCSGVAGSETLATVSARGSSATSTLQLYGGFLAASSTVTSTFVVGNNALHVDATTNHVGVNTSTLTGAALTVDGGAIFSGANSAFGIDETRDFIGIRMTNVVHSGGSSSHFTAGVDLDPNLTMAPLDTSYGAYLNVAGFGINTATSTVVDTVASVRIAQPQIAVGSGGTVTKAASLYVSSPPSGGVDNESLWVDQGNTYLGGLLGVGIHASTNAATIRGNSAPQGLFYGYNSIDASANVAGGEILLGSNPSFQGSIAYTHSTTELYIRNSWNNDAGDIIFQTKSSGTPINALRIKGSGNVGIGAINPISFKLQVAGNVGPSSTDAYDIGSPSLSWANIYASGTAFIGTDAVVSGHSVCLANGTNCPADTTDFNWTYNAPSDFVRNATATTDIVLGNTATSTVNGAPVWFDLAGGTVGTSTVYFGYSTNTNVLVGTTTYSGGLDPQFALNGNDLLVQGQIGSIGGLFSATGVQVGTGSTVYGDGNLYKTSAGDFNLFLDNAASSWRMSTAGTERFTVASSGNVGIGLPTPSEALDVKGNIQDILHANSAFSSPSSLAFIAPRETVVQGQYAYVATDTGMAVVDVSDPNNPQQVGGFSDPSVSGPTNIAVSGRYAYLVSSVASLVSIFDVSNPSTPARVTTISTGVGTTPNDIFVNGRYAYVIDNSVNRTFKIFDISNPAAPFQVSSSTVPSLDPESVYVQGRYAYITAGTSDSFYIYDVTDPTAPVLVGTKTYTSGNTPSQVVVSGRYAYTPLKGIGLLSVINVSNPSNPIGVGTSTVAAVANAGAVAVSGRYAYVIDTSGAAVNIVDVASSTNPVDVKTVAISGGAAPGAAFISGRYLYVTDPTAAKLTLVDINGIETNGLIAHSAELGSLQVLTNGTVANDFTVGGGLNVGMGGIFSAGSLAISATNTTSTISFAVSSTNGVISNILTARTAGIGLATPAEALDVKGNIQNILYSGQTISQIGFISSGVQPRSVAIQGQYAYVADGGPGVPGTFYVMDISNPKSPAVAGSVSLVTNGKKAIDVAVQGKYAYVLTTTNDGATNDFMVFDVSNPSAPISVGRSFTNPDFILPTNAKATALAIAGRYAYLTFANDKLVTIDISNPSLLPIVSTFSAGDFSDFRDVYVQNSYAYVADYGSNALLVIDISNPSAPTVSSTRTLGISNGASAVSVSGRYAYVTAATSHVVSIFDVKSPTSGAGSVASLTLPAGSSPADIVVSGRYAYVAASGTNQIIVLDVANPTSPAIVSTGSTTDHPMHLAISGKRIYTAEDNGPSPFVGIMGVYDALGVETNGLVAANAELGALNVQTNGSVANDFTIGNALGVGAGGIYSIGTLSIASAATSSFNGSVEVGLSSGDLKVDNSIKNTLDLGTSFTKISNTLINSGGAPTDMFVSGKYAYTANYSGDNMSIIDVSNPTNPSVVTSTSVGGTGTAFYAQHIYVSGRYAYLTLPDTKSGSLSIIDVSNPGTPSLVSNTLIESKTSSPEGIFVAGRYAYTADNASNTMSIIDVSNPAAPVVVTSTYLGADGSYNPQSVYVAGRYAYVVNKGSASVSIVDVSDPSAPVVTGSTFLDLFSDPGGIFVSGRYAYTANQSGNSISIIDVASATNPFVVKTLPLATNSNPSTIFVSGRYVYTSDGNFVGAPVMTIIDVASATTPFVVKTIANAGSGIGGLPQKVFVAGRYAYLASDDDVLTIYDTKGIETNGLIAASAEVGNLQVLTNGTVANDFTVGGGLNVGMGGINSQGVVSIFSSSTSATTTWIFNSASATAPVLQVTGGCGNSSTTAASLILAGNSVDQRKFQVNCAGSVNIDGTYNTGGADFAEYFSVPPLSYGLAAGDVVVQSAISTSTAERSSAAARRWTLGVISDRSGFIGNGDERFANNPAYKVVALLGQTPVHASAVSSPIAAGDELMAGDGGVAVKAIGPGMIIGRAIEPLPSGTGTIMAFISPQWWAGDLLVTDGGGRATIRQNLTLTPSSTASLASPFVDSSIFSMEGSAWDSGTGSAVATSFNLLNHTVSATSSSFELTNVSGTPLFSVSNAGDASIAGDLSVGHRLFLGSKTSGAASLNAYLYADDTLAPSSTYIATNADGWETLSTYDYAERYESTENLTPGDLVTADASGVNRVKRATSIEDPILGIVSTKPGFVTGGYAKGTYPIALAGRVPTRVSTANGAVSVGDRLMASQTPGVAVKATGAGNTVGIALEAYDAPAEGLISVFVKPGWQGGAIASGGSVVTSPSVVTVTAPAASDHRSGLAKIFAGSTSVNVTYPSLLAYPIVHVQPYGEVKAGMWVTTPSDTGFTITLGEAPTFDLVLAWTAEPSATGEQMFFSDNTSLPYDPTSGIPYGPAAPTSTTDVTPTVTSTPPVDGSVTSTTTTVTSPEPPPILVDTTSFTSSTVQ